MENFSLVNSHSLLDNPLVLPQSKYEFNGLERRKAKIGYKRKCEDSRFVENACSAFLLAPTSHFLLYPIFAFLLFGSRRKLVFKSWMGERGLSRSLWFLFGMKISRRGVSSYNSA